MGVTLGKYNSKLLNVEHPPHYKAHPSGVECIQITEHMNFCLGNAIKYVWRAGVKSKDPVEDLSKAVWYINREIAKIEKNQEERVRELVRYEYTESNNPSSWHTGYFQKGSLWYPEYSIQYSTTSEDHR
jgi:hypothetical protein